MGVATAPDHRSYRSDRREAQARATRRRILTTAREVFPAGGYAGTTVRAVAAAAGVSVPSVEALFGTKARLLKAAIDVAIVDDDEPVAVLERAWVEEALATPTVPEFCAVAARVLAAAQQRSAGLVLAVFEGSRSDPELGALAEQLVAQRAVTASWFVDTLTTRGALRRDIGRSEAVDDVWLLMDPAVYDRLTRLRHWTTEHYRDWFATALLRLLTDGH